MALDIVNQQRPLKGGAAEEDTFSQATTIPSLGYRISLHMLFLNSTHEYKYIYI